MMEVTEIGLLRFAQRERFVLTKRLNRNIYVQFLLIVFGLFLLFNEQFRDLVSTYSKQLAGEVIPEYYVKLSLPVVLHFLWVSFGYLFAQFARNKAAMITLYNRAASKCKFDVVEDHNMRQMFRAYTMVEPILENDSWKDRGRWPMWMSFILVILLMIANHFVVLSLMFSLLHMNAIAMFFAYLLLLVSGGMFYFHFYYANKENAALRELAIYTSAIALGLFIVYMILPVLIGLF